jgi:hypothetical protein
MAGTVGTEPPAPPPSETTVPEELMDSDSKLVALLAGSTTVPETEIPDFERLAPGTTVPTGAVPDFAGLPPSTTVPIGRVPDFAGPPPSTTAPPRAVPDFGGQAAGRASAPVAVASRPKGSFELMPIEIDLPAPAFRGTPVPQQEPNVEKPSGKPRPPFLAPKGTVNLALGKPVACSDPMPAAGEVDYVTDGAKDASDFGYLELRPGTEWVQVDLGQKATIYAVIVWHNHAEARVYRDVIVQVSDDPDFLDAKTVFNNDYDDSSGMGVGGAMGYVETSEGRLIDTRGVEGRYVRLYSRGNHIDNKNHYTEVAVYGRPAK